MLLLMQDFRHLRSYTIEHGYIGELPRVMTGVFIYCVLIRSLKNIPLWNPLVLPPTPSKKKREEGAATNFSTACSWFELICSYSKVSWHTSRFHQNHISSIICFSALSFSITLCFQMPIHFNTYQMVLVN